jgi:tetratricopeptide (TPR) repeat protein
MLGIGEVQMFLDMPDEAHKTFERVVDLYPDDVLGYFYVAMSARHRGDIVGSAQVLAACPDREHAMYPYFVSLHAWEAHEFEAGNRALEKTAGPMYADEMRVYPNTILSGLNHLMAGDSVAARADLEAALDTLRTLAVERPDDHRLYGAMGLALAGLGRGEEAVANGRRSVELYPMSKDRYGATWQLIELARIYALAGYKDEALAQLDDLLSIPSIVTTDWIRIEPAFDTLHDDPRYEALLRKYEPTS